MQAKNIFLFAVIILIVASISILAQGPDKTMGQIVNLFEGTWKMEGKETYERWERTADSSFKGKGYNLKDSQEKITEYFEIKEINGKIYYLATALNQNNGATIRFALTKSDNGEFVFENPEHDFPQKLIYKKLSDREMFVQVLGGDGKGFSFKTSKLQVENIKPTAQTLNQDLFDLKETERAFAAETVKDGFRAGFFKYFADDGISFNPHPEILRENLKKSPPSNQPRTTIFNWQPMFGDISLDGDLGYATGPVLFTDLPNHPNPQPPRHGLYFSVWQKQADKTWRVVVDLGADVPQAVAPIDTGFTAAVPSGLSQKDIAKLKADDYQKLDEKFSSAIKKNGLIKAYQLWVNDQFRIHRKGMMPILTKAGLNKFLENQNPKISFKRLGGKVATSQDLAFTYGSFQTTLEKEAKPEGYFVHVWRRDKSGRWKLVIDVLTNLPKG